MARPVVTAWTARLFARFPRFVRAADAALDYPFLRYLSLLGDLADVDAAVIRDGGARLADPATADARALPWLAHLAGVDSTVYPNPAGDTATGGVYADYAGLRAAIRYADDARAFGATKAVLAAIRPLLSGTRTAEVIARDPATFSYLIRVYEREVPNLPALLAVLEATRPASLRATLTVSAGQTWADLAARGLTYSELGSFTHEQIRTAVPGQPMA